MAEIKENSIGNSESEKQNVKERGRSETIEVATEEGLEKFVQETEQAIDKDAQKFLEGGKREANELNDAISADEASLQSTEQQGGFRSRLENIAQRVRSAATVGKEKIRNLFRHSPAQQEKIITTTLVPETSDAQEPTIESEQSKEQEQLERRKESEPLKELQEYLAKEVFPTLGISREQQEAALTETSEDRKEVLERSFENIRGTIESFYEIETIEGRLDQISYQKEKRRRVFEAVTPLLKEELEAKGLSFSEEELGLDVNDIDATNHIAENINKLISNKRYELIEAIEKEVFSIIEKEKRYEDIEVPNEGETNEEIWEEYFKKVRRVINNKVEATLKEKGWTPPWVYELSQKVAHIAQDMPMIPFENFTIKKSKEQLLVEIVDEQNKVAESQFLCVNIPPKKLEHVLQTGEFKGLFSLDEAEMKKRASELGEGELYMQQRKDTEQALGTYNPEKAVIYGTLASADGIEEKYGGASVYGSIFFKLKPEVLQRTLFTEGDSLTIIGLTSSVVKKLEKRSIKSIDYQNFARARQVSLEHAPLAKTLINIEKQRDTALRGERSPFVYLKSYSGRPDLK